MSGVCRSCQAPIEWAVTETGKRMPVDHEPVVGATILLRHTKVGEPPLAHVTTKDERAELERQAANRDDELRLFVSHFSSCPNSAFHRKKA